MYLLSQLFAGAGFQDRVLPFLPIPVPAFPFPHPPPARRAQKMLQLRVFSAGPLELGDGKGRELPPKRKRDLQVPDWTDSGWQAVFFLLLVLLAAFPCAAVGGAARWVFPFPPFGCPFVWVLLQYGECKEDQFPNIPGSLRMARFHQS